MPRGTYCDPAGQGVQSQTCESEFKKLQQKGLMPIAKPSSVRDGCVRIMDALAATPTCRCWSRAAASGWIEAPGSGPPPDKNHPDVYDENSDYDHALDALRYFFVNRPVGGNVDWVSNDYDSLPRRRRRHLLIGALPTTLPEWGRVMPHSPASSWETALGCSSPMKFSLSRERHPRPRL